MMEVKAYVCSHCKAAGKVRRAYCTRQSAQRHESWCSHNPATRSCATCGLWVRDDDGDDGMRSLAYCYDDHDDHDENARVRRPVSRCAFWVSPDEYDELG